MRIDLEEYGGSAFARLDAEEAQALRSTGLVDVLHGEIAGEYELRPQGRVGAVICGATEVRVAPKVTIDRLVFMLGHSLRGVTWQDVEVGVDAESDVVHVVAEAFARSLARALGPGLLQGYRVTEEALPVVRGRIRIDDQLKRRPGQWMPIEVSYDDFTIDIAENQILRAAIEYLARNTLVGPKAHRRLMGLAPRFADVSRLVRGAPPPAWHVSRLNARFESPLRLAELILASTSFEHRVGEVPMNGFVLDVARIFEDFVTVTMRTSLQRLMPGTVVEGQFPMWLDTGSVIFMKPDIVWVDAAQAPLAVLDAKYKAEKPSGFPNADIYQAHAYATALGLPEVHLVYAKGNESIQSHEVRQSGVVVHAHVLDLSATPSALLAQVDTLAAKVAEGARIEALAPP
jgi:5-methylcytosine-specific restriction enzyme subunit McrC